jgi:dTMP kinase
MFVTFEGLDGSGKTTQVELLRERLEAEGREVVAVREPGGTELGEGIRTLLLHGPHMTAWSEAALYAAARAELVDEVIAPALERGADVLCDRYVDSSLAYQGVARGLGVERVLELNLPGIRGLLPDRTFVLLLDADESARRVGASPDRLEREGDEFRRRVEGAYRELAGRYPDRIVMLDGALPPGELADRIHAELRRGS